MLNCIKYFNNNDYEFFFFIYFFLFLQALLEVLPAFFFDFAGVLITLANFILFFLFFFLTSSLTLL